MLQSISYKLMTRIFTQNVFLCIPLKKRSFYRRLFCWSVVQALSAQYLLTPLLESCPNLVQWIPLESRYSLLNFRSKVKVELLIFILSVIYSLLIFVQLLSTQYLLPPLLWNCQTWLCTLWILTADLHSLSISKDSLLVSYQTWYISWL